MNDNIEGCFFVGSAGLFWIYCPFHVRCRHQLPDMDKGAIVAVSGVRSSIAGEIVYRINNRYYYHQHFRLI